MVERFKAKWLGIDGTVIWEEIMTWEEIKERGWFGAVEDMIKKGKNYVQVGDVIIERYFKEV